MKDHQQQTFVTKHDLALLHKKIIATDLIVQKYQEANKALVALQVENEQLRQQIEQITHECCIFGKQVTECTQECDLLKEQIEKLNVEKLQLQSDLQVLRDENMTYRHEVMVLSQYESLKEINDQSTKIIERQQKEIARLQLRAQRHSPVVYKPIRSSQEATETETALVESKKSVRELKLALGRLMNYLTNSKVEIPGSLHIRPVLKAHDINDDYLEREGEYVLQRVKIRSKRATQSAVVPDEKKTDDDDEDENEGLIDVPPAAATTATVPATSEPAPGENTKELPPLPSSVAQKKTRKRTKKREVEDLAHELEMAIAATPDRTHVETTSHLVDLFGEDVTETGASSPAPAPAPVTFKRPSIPRISSSITFTRRRASRTEERPTENVSFLSDEEEMETETVAKPDASFPPAPPPRSTEFRTSISFLSEDDDRASTPLQPQSPEFPPPTAEPTIEKESPEVIDEIPPTPPSTLDSTEEPMPIDEIHSVTKPIEEVLSPVEPTMPPVEVVEKPVEPAIPTKDPIRIDLVFRLLKILTQLPVQMKALRPCHRRIRLAKAAKRVEITPLPPVIEEEPVPMDTNLVTEPPVENVPPITEPIPPVEEQFQPVELENDDVPISETPPEKEIETPIKPPQDLPVSVDHRAEPIRSMDRSVRSFQGPMNIETPTIPHQLSPTTVSLVSRLLHVLITLPVPNAHLPPVYRQRKRQVRPASQAPPRVVAPRPTPIVITSPSRLSQPASRMTTRSLTSIRACIARCNRPEVSSRKRSAQDSPTVAPLKRLRSVQSDTNEDEFDRLKKFLHTFSREVNVELKTWIEKKLQENSTSFTEEFYRLVMEIFYSRANVILPLAKNLHPYEESLKVLVKCLDHQSKEFSSNLLAKLKHAFEVEAEQKTLVHQRLKILNRFYFLICSISLPPPTLIYTRLFDIGFALPKEFLTDALHFVHQHCPTINSKSSNGFLHRILFEIFSAQSVEPSIEYLEKLFFAYLRENGDQEDFIRSSILLCRHQSWSWCSQEFCLKLLFPLFNGVKDNSLIFILLQNILFIFKDNDEFRQDRTFHSELEQLLSSKTALSTDSCHRRDQILFMLRNCS